MNSWAAGRSFSRCSRILSAVINQPMLSGYNRLSLKISQKLEKVGSRYFGSIYEPDYLDSSERYIPRYELLNFQIKGYDFPLLEAYGKFIHNTAERIGIDVEDSWATPCKKLKISRLIPESTIIDCEYQLNLYERNVQLSEVPTTMLQLFIYVVETALPAGVTLHVQPHQKEYAEVRYIPDLELKELREKLDTMTTFVSKAEGYKPKR